MRRKRARRAGSLPLPLALVLALVPVPGVLTGCASPMDGAGPAAWETGVPETWKLTGAGRAHRARSLARGSREAAAERESAAPSFTGASGPDDYARAALAANPSLAAAAERVRRLRERMPQVRSLEDPIFRVDPVGEMAETAAGQVRLKIEFDQKLPFPGKLQTRGRIAAGDVAAARADRRARQLWVVARTRTAYWALYAAVRAIESTHRSRALLAQLEAVVRARYRAGEAGQPQVLGLSTELANLDKKLHTLRQRRVAAEAMLNQLLDRPIEAPLPDPAPREPERLEASLETMLGRATAGNPAVEKAQARIAQARERRRLAELERWPDVTARARYNAVDDSGLSRVADGTDSWWLGLAVNLPIWTARRDAAEREALRGLLEAVATLAAERNRVAYEIREAWDRMEAHHHHLHLLGGQIVPESREAAEGAMAAYRGGEGDYLSVIDHWRRMWEFELMLHHHRAELGRAVAELERAIGRGAGGGPGTRRAATGEHPGEHEQEHDHE